ncbi:MAG: tetratricopeptide (TPR) repeat protein [Rhodothermales bacterium]|jgi:tetratricopeptide (TPR) repeat protein
MRRLLPVFCLVAAACQPLPAVPDLPSLVGLDEGSASLILGKHEAARSNPSAEKFGELGLTLLAFDFPTEAADALSIAASGDRSIGLWAYYLGILNRQRGDLQAANEWFRETLAREGQDHLASIRLGESLLELGELEESGEILSAVLEVDSTLTLVHFLLGQVLSEQGNHNEAIRSLETTLRLQPRASQVRGPLAAAYTLLGDQARSQFHSERRGTSPVTFRDARISALDSLRFLAGSARVLRAERLIGSGDFAGAITVLEAALLDQADAADILVKLGVARAGAGSRAGAIVAFRRAVTLDSTRDEAHFNLGAIALSVGDTSAAEQSFRSAMGAAESFSAGVELARVLRRSGRCDDAIPLLERALRSSPASSDIRMDLVLCLNQRSRDREAIALLEAGLDASAESLGYLDALARILATTSDPSLRDPERALDLAESALASQQRTETLETAALALAAHGNRRADATRLLDTAIFQSERDELEGYSRFLRGLRRDIGRGDQSRLAWPPMVYRR